MVTVLRFNSTTALTVDDDTAVFVEPKQAPWTARITSDVPYFVKIGIDAVATDQDNYISEFSTDFLFSVAKGERVSILGSDFGQVWVAHVSLSS
jgi:hypothetical protein